MGASLTGSGLGNTRGDLENCEWTEGDDVTSGLNFCGVFGGVATAIYGFDLLPFSFLLVFDNVPVFILFRQFQINVELVLTRPRDGDDEPDEPGPGYGQAA